MPKKKCTAEEKVLRTTCIKKQRSCPICKGKGENPIEGGALDVVLYYSDCPACKGTGKIKVEKFSANTLKRLKTYRIAVKQYPRLGRN